MTTRGSRSAKASRSFAPPNRARATIPQRLEAAPPGSANATIFEPGAAPRKLPPPAATTTYCRPSLPRNVIGTACAHAGSSVSHSCLPLFDSNARNRQSIVAPMKSTPPAVTMLPPMLGVPVLSKPFAFSDSKNPIGTFHAISPRLTSTATSSPNGGAEHGILVSGFQKRPTAPPHGLRRTHVVGPPPRAVPCTIFATCPRFITLVNTRPSVGSYDKPFQLPPPSVLGNVTIVPSVPGGVYG